MERGPLDTIGCRRSKGAMTLQMPTEFLIVFEPVTHVAHFIDVKGEPTKSVKIWR
jgi:hypothetical protein